MAKTPEESLKELAIRLDQSHRDGKWLVSTETLSHVITLLLRVIREK